MKKTSVRYFVYVATNNLNKDVKMNIIIIFRNVSQAALLLLLHSCSNDWPT